MSTTRIYIVTTPAGEHLVEAQNPSQAVKAITHAGVTVSAASTKDVARLLGAGVALVDASATAEEPAVAPT